MSTIQNIPLDILAYTATFVDNPLSFALSCRQLNKAMQRSFQFILHDYRKKPSLQCLIKELEKSAPCAQSQPSKEIVRKVYQKIVHRSAYYADELEELEKNRLRTSSMLSAFRLARLAALCEEAQAKSFITLLRGLSSENVVLNEEVNGFIDHPDVSFVKTAKKIKAILNDSNNPFGLVCISEFEIYAKSLQSLPPEFDGLKQLEFLRIWDTKIKRLPKAIGHFKELKTMQLWRNPLESFPKAIGSLSNLTELQAISCQIKELPMQIGNLQQLKKLELSGNHLQSIPSTIGKLSCLEVLVLDRNILKNLPEEMSRLSSLQTLSLAFNRIKNFPTVILTLSQLINLCLKANQLQTVPVKIGELGKLNSLNLQDNQITFFPQSLYNLKQRINIKLEGNPPTLFNKQELHEECESTSHM